MKKVLIVFDGPNYSEGALRFVAGLNALQPVLATAVCMPRVDDTKQWSAFALGNPGEAGVFLPAPDNDDEAAMNANKLRFKQHCEQNLLKYRLHNDCSSFPFRDLKKETRFSDVMVLGEQLFLNQLPRQQRFTYLTDTLHTSECPVVVVPEAYDFPQYNILAYDGSSESAFAIKQFAYIFPELARNPTMLVYVQPDESKEIPEMDFIEELATQHYVHLTFFKLNIDPALHFGTWLENSLSSILVSGAYGRSIISQFIKRSFVTDPVREHLLPVFICHR
ncbi:hypothetical protein EXU57_04040 [Segetibacter sp. 3557_3]|uniref:hypothetical protein n=1 Tax=Segetibacter sp. 3557_3 TaxID=2547429 RepID=UPI0010590583|nr:hypothetical protein [Segetibacter sp. 3557_3]TDH29245.1 hypothetical protein EXU57_04040 [Segetibacter sp. 3557_3]